MLRRLKVRQQVVVLMVAVAVICLRVLIIDTTHVPTCSTMITLIAGGRREVAAPQDGDSADGGHDAHAAGPVQVYSHAEPGRCRVKQRRGR